MGNKIMIEILIATGNQGKRQEMEQHIDIGDNIQWRDLSEFPPSKDPEENGKTFEENAHIKAKFFAEKHKIPTLGEDSGFIVSAFPEKFGIYTKRTISASSDEQWLHVFMDMMKNEKDRRITFYSAISFVDPLKNYHQTVLGKCHGTLLEECTTTITPGIPVSSIFVPSLTSVPLSELSPSQHKSISHRGQSAQMIETTIRQYYTQR